MLERFKSRLRQPDGTINPWVIAITVTLATFMEVLDTSIANVALSPGGAVIMLMMPVVGMLVSRVDTRWLIAFGCAVSASALFVMAGWNLNLDYHHAVLGRMLQAFGLAFLFIPINVAAFAYLPREKTNMGTGIINLARNIGASVGIASVTTLLERRTQYHVAQLGEHVNPMSEAYRNMIAGLTAKFSSASSSGPSAAARAQGMIHGIIQRQAAMLSFLDDFKLLGVIFFAIIPIFFLMRRPRMSGGSVPVH